jgi:hypothetical protein
VLVVPLLLAALPPVTSFWSPPPPTPDAPRRTRARPLRVVGRLFLWPQAVRSVLHQALSLPRSPAVVPPSLLQALVSPPVLRYPQTFAAVDRGRPLARAQSR